MSAYDIMQMSLYHTRQPLFFHGVQAFLNFVAMACFARVADFQAKWGVGPSALSALAVVVSVMGLVLSLYCIWLLLNDPMERRGHSPLVHLMDARHGAVFAGLMVICYTAIALATSVSAFTQPGCRNAENDPHAYLGYDFRGSLRGWCNTKKAGSIFLWFVVVRWLHVFSVAAAVIYREWRDAQERARACLPQHRQQEIPVAEPVNPAPVHPNNNPPAAPVRILLVRAPEPAHLAGPQPQPSYKDLKQPIGSPPQRNADLGPCAPSTPQVPLSQSDPRKSQPFCNICRESVPVEQSIRILTCSHVFCTECIEGHVRIQLAHNAFPIDCPDCMTDPSIRERTKISFAQVEGLLTDSEKERWWYLEIAPFAVEVQCPQCKRSAMLDREEFSRVGTLDCPLPGCNARFCKFCMQILTGQQSHTCDGSAEFDRLVTQRDWKRCPGPCGAVVEQDGGCRHMTCQSPGCHTHWCYGCGKLITTSSNPGDAIRQHYRENDCVQFP